MAAMKETNLFVMAMAAEFASVQKLREKSKKRALSKTTIIFDYMYFYWNFSIFFMLHVCLSSVYKKVQCNLDD